MNVSTLFIQVHSSTMWYTRGLKHEETTRIKQGNNIFYMRRWLRLHVAQPIISSYPLPMSMLSPGGIDCNTLRYFHKTLLGPEANKLLHLSIALINFLFEKEGHFNKCFNRISSKMFVLICWFWTELNVWYNACQISSILMDS